MKKQLMVLALLSLLVACQEKATDRTEELEELETRYKGTPEDTAIARQFSTVLAEVALANPSDSLSPFRLLQSALVLRSLPGEELESIVALTKLRTKYPGHEVSPEALFQEAFTWDEFVGNKDEAIEGYREFTEKFPTHPRSATAKELLFLLENDSDVLQLIEGWNKSSNTQEQE
jgi:hypothetical protein